VSAEKFEEKTQDLVEQTMDFVRQLLANNTLSPEQIDVVLLVGGSSRMPMIQKAVKALFVGDGKVRLEDPDLAVAKGAALAAAIEWNERLDKRVRGETDEFSEQGETSGEPEPIQPITEEEAAELRIGIPQQVESGYKEILSRSFGPAVFVDASHYMIDNLLFVGDESPAEATGQYGTMTDNQPAVEFTVFENFAKDRVNKQVTPSVDENGNEQYTDPVLKVKSLGTVHLDLPAGTPKGAIIDVFFRWSAVGLEVRATNHATGETVQTVIESANTMTQEELSEAVKHMATVKTSGNL
jgi:molecular chaperone DnaK (HSP70)